jgi:hypothetical protein
MSAAHRADDFGCAVPHELPEPPAERAFFELERHAVASYKKSFFIVRQAAELELKVVAVGQQPATIATGRPKFYGACKVLLKLHQALCVGDAHIAQEFVDM